MWGGAVHDKMHLTKLHHTRPLSQLTPSSLASLLTAACCCAPLHLIKLTHSARTLQTPYQSAGRGLQLKCTMHALLATAHCCCYFGHS